MSNRESATYLLGVDVGGTNVAVLLVDDRLQPVAQTVQPTDLSSSAATLSSIAAAVQHTLDAPQVQMHDVAAIGMGVPGLVDPATGVVDLAVNLRWQQVAAGAWLQNRFGVPCWLENDVRAAVLGLHRFHYAGTRNLAYVSIGTGISAGLIIDGQLYRGSHGMAGEIGHIQVQPDGALCACGNFGCLETVAAGPAIARLYGQARATLDGWMAHDVYTAAIHGDALAQTVVAQAGRAVAHALYHLMLTCDVETIVLGGGVAGAGQSFLQPILDAAGELHTATRLSRTLLPLGAIRLTPPEYHAGVWGAVALADAQWRITETQIIGIDTLAHKEGVAT